MVAARASEISKENSQMGNSDQNIIRLSCKRKRAPDERLTALAQGAARNAQAHEHHLAQWYHNCGKWPTASHEELEYIKRHTRNAYRDGQLIAEIGASLAAGQLGGLCALGLPRQGPNEGRRA
jgi:hypothetical protein